MIIAAREKASVQIDLVARVYIYNILCIIICIGTHRRRLAVPAKDAPAAASSGPQYYIIIIIISADAVYI